MISQRKIGLYGGSFDPVHHGHLILAREALEKLGLDRVIFIPAGISPHKLARPPAPAELRCEMVEAAIAGDPDFECDDCEVRRGGASFAIDTVRLMRGRHPGAEIFFFIGEDNVDALRTWKDIGALEKLATFVVLSRGAAAGTHRHLSISRVVDISSTDIRNRIASGLPVRYLMPTSACEILTRHRLYRND